MSCTNPDCSSIRRECKFWKDKYLIEKKFRNSLNTWVIAVFGYSVKIEYDKETQSLKLEGTEGSKETVFNAAVPVSSHAKTIIMEDRVGEDDLVEDAEDLNSLATVLAEVAAAEALEEDQFQQNQEEEGQIVQITEDNGDGESQEAHVVWDFEGHGQQASYIILKTPDGNESIPMHLDYSQFFGEMGQNQKNIVVELPTDGQPVSFRLSSSAAKNVVNKKENSATQPPTTQITEQTSKGKASIQKPQAKKAKLTDGGSNSTCSTTASKLNTNTRSTASSTSNGDNGKQIDNQFGLTLREKAEVYVQTKAMEAIRKTSQGYTCTHCETEYIFTSSANALTHTKTHFERKPYNCNLCGEVFAIQKEFLKHKKLNHSKKPLLVAIVGQSPQPTPQISIAPTASEPNSATINNKLISKNGKQLAARNSKNFGEPGPGNTNKQFKCSILGCQWSYINEHELGWHMKAHSQSLV